MIEVLQGSVLEERKLSTMVKGDMKEVGESIKQRRKEMHLSLKEAENATSIRMNYLQAIEDGEISKLISAVYAQGFVRQYAAFLGMDGEKLIKENAEAFSSRAAPQEFTYGIGTLEGRGNPGSGVKWIPNLIWASSVILVIVLAWLLAKFLELL